jgi:hypothetical protein
MANPPQVRDTTHDDRAHKSKCSGCPHLCVPRCSRKNCGGVLEGSPNSAVSIQTGTGRPRASLDNSTKPFSCGKSREQKLGSIRLARDPRPCRRVSNQPRDPTHFNLGPTALRQPLESQARSYAQRSSAELLRRTKTDLQTYVCVSSSCEPTPHLLLYL